MHSLYPLSVGCAHSLLSVNAYLLFREVHTSILQLCKPRKAHERTRELNRGLAASLPVDTGLHREEKKNRQPQAALDRQDSSDDATTTPARVQPK